MLLQYTSGASQLIWLQTVPTCSQKNSPIGYLSMYYQPALMQTVTAFATPVQIQKKQTVREW